MKDLSPRATQQAFDNFFSFSDCEKANGAQLSPSRLPSFSSNQNVATFFRPGILATQESDWAGTGAPQADVTRFRVDF